MGVEWNTLLQCRRQFRNAEEKHMILKKQENRWSMEEFVVLHSSSFLVNKPT